MKMILSPGKLEELYGKFRNMNTNENDFATGEIRRIVQEESDRTSSGATTSLYRKTQGLLQSVTEGLQTRLYSTVVPSMSDQPSASSATPGNSSLTQVQISSIWGPQKEKTKRSDSQPGHPNRFKSNKQISTPNKTKTFYVSLYPEDLEMRDRYSVETDDEILNGSVELSSNYSEDEIRFVLTQLFRTKLSLIQPNSFEFIKRKKRVLYAPLVPDDFKWNFESIKALCSQGKLHCRLKEILVH